MMTKLMKILCVSEAVLQFCRRGASPQGWGANLLFGQHCPEKTHENEQNWTRRRYTRAPPPPTPPWICQYLCYFKMGRTTVPVEYLLREKSTCSDKNEQSLPIASLNLMLEFSSTSTQRLFDWMGYLICNSNLFQQNENKRVSLDATRRQWLDLGIHLQACLTQPETCYVGAAMGMWVRVDSNSVNGIITSKRNENSRGFNLAIGTVHDALM